ncbi:putative nudix hydrolase YeaB [Serinicoccus hydrothermalis]|uniref:Putative nudix hydrolase YeaB n=1 Tax=Serinicoccus hydrothermalis TaxID=1758689 RepID=A0A1B1NBT7_9MICO|nr:CoA pyrophosphatase [Serinicoccus hydrothermalis]ANS78897.1 putative nudix hydrolase YeaB [Serinicoccus hydrothermalis]
MSVDPAHAPPPRWLTDLATRAPTIPGERFSRFLPPPDGGRRHSAVLVLFAPGVRTAGDPEASTVVVTERAHTMRSHAGQPAFPGGGTEPGDRDAAATALREAWEEVGLDPATVDVLALLPTLHIPVSGYDVTPVLAWWREPTPETLWAKDPREVARVLQPEVRDLVDPARRFRVHHPSGFVGPAWDVDGLLLWGFTAGVLDRVLDLGGLTVPWPDAPTRELRL